MKKLLMATSILVLSGCASTPTTKKAPVLRETASVYKKSVESLPEARFRNGICGKLSQQVRAKWFWKDAILAADHCLRAKDLGKVEELAQELALREPSSPWGPYFFGIVAKERREYERALWMTELALKRGPEIGVIHYLKGQVAWLKKDYTNSVKSFMTATELDPSITAAHLFLGRIFFRDQEYQKASKHFYAVLKSESKNPVALSGLAESQLFENNPRGAIETYSRLVEIYPQEGQHLQRMAEIYENVLNDQPRALAAYRRLSQLYKSGRVSKSFDQLDAKIKSLEFAERSLAATKESRSTK